MCLRLVQYVARSGSGGVADLLAAVLCASPCSCRTSWPSASTNSALGAA
jgi:hypothetical protein